MLNAPLSDTLRLQTRSAHQAVDSHPLLAVLTSPDIHPDQYKESLSSMYRAWLPLETAVESGLAAQLGCQTDHRFKDILLFSFKNYFPRRYALYEDLEALNVAPAHGGTRSDNRFSTPTSLIGGLYVYFGAQMGSKLISARLTSALPGSPAQFFGCTKERLPDFWQSFRASVDALSVSPEEQHAMVTSAIETFRCFRRHLDLVGV